MPERSEPESRAFRSPWAMLVFLIGYVALLLVVSHYYLIPATQALKDATASERRLLSASSALLLAVVLFIVLMGIIVVLRVRRFFQSPHPSKPTEVIDAWAESGKRARSTEDSE